MDQRPTLVIQLQRMGDLILSFPLLQKLSMVEPYRPIWVVAEPMFYQELIPIAPTAIFFEPSMIGSLQQ